MSEDYRSREERKQKQTKKTKRVKKRKNSFFKTLMYAISIMTLLVVAVGIFFAVNVIRKAPPLDEALLKDPLSSTLVDVNGNKFAELGKENREKVTYDQLPDNLINAVLAIEDVRFFNHNGIDIKRTAGSILANFKAGRKAQGGSTITQQVVKRSFLSPEKTYTRKFQEWYLALKLEQKYSKEQILEMYLNKIFYGEYSYGVQKAAQTYFGKDVEKINLSEAALLAGIPNLPTTYNPYNNPDLAKKRRDLVLEQMEKNGFITEAQMKKAQAVKIEDMLVEQKGVATLKYQSFVDTVLDEVEKLKDVNVYTDGVIIHTTLDPTIQERVDLLLSENSPIQYPNDRYQAGISVVDPQTGAIKAIGGGRNQEDVFRGFNYATELKRQPGSTFKPITDYGPAIENLNWSTYQLLEDKPYTYSDGTPIKNADNSYKGTMTMREALVWSRNIPALKTMQEVGLENSKKFAQSLGIPFEGHIYESDSIGGSTLVSPLEMSGAYATFANGGVYNEPFAITKIEFQDGEVTEIEHKSKKVIKDSTAYMVTDMLKDVMDRGTGTLANVPSLDLAGKTGTTNFSPEDIAKYNLPANSSKDSWMVGYTPELSVAVWTGYSENGEGNYLGPEGQRIARYLFKDIMANSKQKGTQFKKPNSVVELPVVKGSNPARIAANGVPSSFVTYELFVKGHEPSSSQETVQINIASPSNLTATETGNTREYELSWSYPDEVFINSSVDDDMKEQLLRNGVEFEVSYTIKDTGKSTVIKTSDAKTIIAFPEGTTSVNIQVTAKLIAAPNIKSSPASISITLPVVEEEVPEEEIPEEEGGQEEVIPPVTTPPKEEEVPEEPEEEEESDTGVNGGEKPSDQEEPTNPSNGNNNNG